MYQFHVKELEIVSSTFFPYLNAETIRLEINNGFRFGRPFVNFILSLSPIPIPNNFFGLFELKDLVIDYFNDYIYAGATPIFLDPLQTNK